MEPLCIEYVSHTHATQQGRVFTEDELDEYVEREFGVGRAEAERRTAALREWAAANAKEVGPHDDRYLVMFLR